jgi:arylformamidase
LNHVAKQGGGPKIWLDLDQAALDIAYDQSLNASNFMLLRDRMTRNSLQMRQRIGDPQVYQYGTESIQKLYFYAASVSNAPVHIHVHGGAWRQKSALDVVFPAEHFLAQGISFAVFDFISVDETKGDLRPVLSDVCACLAWLARHAKQLGADPDRLYLSGFSSGAHLASAALLCDWRAHGLPGNPYKAAVLASGIYDLHPVRLSSRSKYVAFTDEIEDGMSAQRHVDRCDIPLALACGDCESSEFQRQTRDFFAALKKAGKLTTLLVHEGYNHLEMMETFGNPFGPLGRAAIEQING